MAGTFSLTARPKRPGGYFRWIARQQEPVLINTLGVVAIAFTHDWGPAESIVEVDSWGDFLDIFGDGNAPTVITQGYAALRQAFQGQGLPGKGGAGAVLAFRMVGASGLAASRVIAGVGGAALTITAVYPGSFGNRIKYGIEPDAKSPGDTDNLVIYVDSTEVERWAFLRATGIAGLPAILADAVTGSHWVRGSGATNGTNLTSTGGSPVQLQNGDDGNTLLAADYTAWMAALEAKRFSLLAPANLTDSTIMASLVSWLDTRNRKGKRCMGVFGGVSGDTMATAITRSATMATPNIVNLGAATVKDVSLGTLATAQLAPRVAGILADNGETRGLTFTRLAGVELVTSPTDAEIESGIDGGVTTLSRDSHPTAPVRIEKGVTTFISKTDPDRPYDVYKVPKFVRVQQSIETELTEWAEQNVIGQMQVNDGTRAYVRGQTEARLKPREATGAIQPGWTVTVASQPAPSDNDDFVALQFALAFGRDVEQVLNTVIVS